MRFPVSELRYAEDHLDRPEPRQDYVVVATSKGVALVSSEGVVSYLPVEGSTRSMGEALILDQAVRDSHGRSVVVLSYAQGFDPQEPRVQGETYVVRPTDGLSFKVSNYLYLLGKEPQRSIRLVDGILTVPGLDRALDVNNLEAESRFRPGTPGVVRNADGSPIKDLSAAFAERFPQLSDAQLQSTFETSEAGERAIESMRLALAHPEAGNVALLGDSGVGKTQLVRAFLSRIRKGKYPEIPKTTRLIELSGSELGQGTKYVGTMEAVIQLLIEGSKEAPTLVFIDEVHALRGLGAHSASSVDVVQMLKPALTEGRIRLLGASTPAEFDTAFSGDRAWMRRVSKVMLLEPTEAELPKYVRSWIAKQRRQAPSEDVIQMIIRVATRFDGVGVQPNRTTELLGAIYGQLDLQGRLRDAPTKADVEAAALKRYGLPPEAFDPKGLRARLDSAPRAFDERVVGQTLAKQALIQAVSRAFAGTQDSNKPAVRALFVGPPGVGKSELGFTLGDAFNVPVTRIEMAKYAAGGIELFQRELLQAIRRGAYSVLMLDEIEKAHPKVQEALLAALDSGVIHVQEALNSVGDTSVVKVSLKNCMIVATGNAGQDWILKGGAQGGSSLGFSRSEGSSTQGMLPGEFREALIQDGISEPVLDRFTYVVPLQTPTRDEFRRIVELHVARAARNMGQQMGLTLEIQNAAEFVDYAVERFYVAGKGSRDVHRIVDAWIGTEATRIKLAGLSKVSTSGGRLRIEFEKNAFEEAYYLRPKCNDALGK